MGARMFGSSVVGKIEDVFADNQFNARAQRKYLAPNVFSAFQESLNNGKSVDQDTCDGVAAGLLRWAVDHGATHYSHWFVPLTGKPAAKHDSFIRRAGDHVINAFTGKALAKGEPDGSSFPNGGFRSTHTARGYTVWDPSTPCWIQRNETGATLMVPCVFVSWRGHSLDEKTPLLASITALNKFALRMLQSAGDEGHNYIHSDCGLEQEFFLVDAEFVQRRPDILQTGRTVLGRAPPKGQNLDDHYFAELGERHLNVMAAYEREAWKLGIPQTTRHKEVAPGQYETAPVFSASGVACDQNLVAMDVMQRAARQYGMEALFHEKPFKGVNGSGKHNNWSVGSNKTGTFFEPGDSPSTNLNFMLFMAATLRGLHLYGDLLRVSIASASNDFRLGANEAPPAIMSAYLGEEIQVALDKFVSGDASKAKFDLNMLGINVGSLPRVKRDATDRNRTSPFAFTGNKFEFRAVGASHAPHRSTWIINAIVAESCGVVADLIDKKLGAKANTASKAEREAAATAVAKELLTKHKAIIFNGNGYSKEWHEEAKTRGLPNNKTTPEALAALTAQKNIDLLTKVGVLSEEGVRLRANAWIEQYIRHRDIEATSLSSLVNTKVLPAVLDEQKDVAKTISTTETILGTPNSEARTRLARLVELGGKLSAATRTVDELREQVHHVSEDLLEQARFSCAKLLPALDEARSYSDELEGLIHHERWPLPSYHEMLFVGHRAEVA